VVYKIFVLALALLAGCATTPPQPVLVPVPQPCRPAIPEEPERVRDQLTGDAGTDSGILAASYIELRAWGVSLRELLEACGG